MSPLTSSFYHSLKPVLPLWPEASHHPLRVSLQPFALTITPVHVFKCSFTMSCLQVCLCIYASVSLMRSSQSVSVQLQAVRSRDGSLRSRGDSEGKVNYVDKHKTIMEPQQCSSSSNAVFLPFGLFMCLGDVGWVQNCCLHPRAAPPSPPQPHQLTSLPPPAQTGCADGDTESSLVLVPLTQERLTPPLPHSLPSPLSHCSPCRQFHSISLLPVSTSVHLAPVIGPQFKSCC